jgi:hypothetical protein
VNPPGDVETFESIAADTKRANHAHADSEAHVLDIARRGLARAVAKGLV